jgi:type II secretory pathway component GspD/PulD (secretin)|tara:strand:+ start:1091 stop:2797 length:1707 start_codon:yes stop_codon:yes gene_type:complete
MKIFRWAFLFINIFALPVNADKIKLVNAPIDAVTAYFSQLTGNTYILDFMPSQKISISKEISGTNNIHQFFVDLINDIGGEVQKISNNSFKVSEKLQEQEILLVPTEQIIVPETTLKRISLEKKISKDGIRELIRTVPVLQNLTVISDNNLNDSILVTGQSDSIEVLQNLINKLESFVEIKNLELIKKPTVQIEIKKPSKQISIIEVVNLNFADAEELVISLSSLLSSDANTTTVSISAHQSANQVVLSGTPSSVNQALSVVALMDRAPRQVYVDAIIAEISEDSAQKLGLQFSANSGNIGASSATGLTGDNIGTLANSSFLSGAAGGLITFGAGANKIPDIGVMLNALKGDTDNRILSTPSLMTTENKESTILIGQNVPFITGSYTNQQGDGTAPFQTIKREDLGTKLKLKPKIGENGDIIMEIWQEVSRIDQSAVGLSDVVTVKRQISTVVSAKEGETIAIGGLRVEQEEIGVSKIPILGDIPLLGLLFRQESSKTVSRNLAIFLRPTLVSSKEQRTKILDAWKEDLGDNLYEYDKKEMISRTPSPVGKRMQTPLLRPSKKFLDKK